jgi:hypothetical protein
LVLNELIKLINIKRSDNSIKITSEVQPFPSVALSEINKYIVPESNFDSSSFQVYTTIRIDSILDNAHLQAESIFDHPAYKVKFLNQSFSHLYVFNSAWFNPVRMAIVLYRPCYLFLEDIKLARNNNNIHTNEKLMYVANRYAKQTYYEKNLPGQSFGFMKSTPLQMLKDKNYLARSFEVLSIADNSVIADDIALQRWLNNPIDKEILLNPVYTEVGYCRYQDTWVLILAKPKDKIEHLPKRFD